jgi:general secretion pathway protein G
MMKRDSISVVTKSRGAFTLLEILLVLGILALLTAIVVPSLMNNQKKGMIRATEATIAGVDSSLKMYAAEHQGEYPEGSQDEVFALLLDPGKQDDGRPRAPYIERFPKDAWDQSLFYEFPTTKHARTERPAIWSAGPNRKNEFGHGDDVVNWEVSE